LAGGYIKLLLLLLLCGKGKGLAVFLSAAAAAATQPPGGFGMPAVVMCSRHSATTPDTYGQACMQCTADNKAQHPPAAAVSISEDGDI
jgi:hypothetical protein